MIYVFVVAVADVAAYAVYVAYVAQNHILSCMRKIPLRRFGGGK